MFIPLHLYTSYLRHWLWPPYVPPNRTTWQGAGKRPTRTFIKQGMAFLGRSMVMELDPKFVAERALLSKIIFEHLENREHYGFITEQEKENWYAALGKVVTPLRDKVKTREQRKKKAEEMKAQRLNGKTSGFARNSSLSVFSQLKDSVSCTKV